MHPSFYMLEKELIEHKINTRLPLFVALCGLLLFVSLFFNGAAQRAGLVALAKYLAESGR